MKLLAGLCSLAALGAADAEANAALDAYIVKQMAKGHIPGLSAVALVKDKIVWSGHYGSTKPSDKNAPKVMNTTVFEFASLSKTLIGVSVMVLKDKGLLDPEDDINKYLPFELRNPNFPDAPITIHGLSTHTSSLRDKYYDTLPGGTIYHEGDSPISFKDFYGYMFTKSGKWYSKNSFWNKKPQTHFDYCNICATMAAYVVEIIAQKNGLGTSYADFVRKEVLAPLGITNAGYLVADFGGEDKIQPPKGAIPSAYKEGRKSSGGYDSYCFYGFPDYADGSFKGSALDYAKVFGAFINDGTYQGVQLLKPATVAYMKEKYKSPCSPLPCGGAMPQGNAFFYYDEKDLVQGRSMIGHNGGEMGIATEAFYNVKTNVGFVVLSNGDWGASNKQIDAFGDAFENIEMKILSEFEGVAHKETKRTRKTRKSRRLSAMQDAPVGNLTSGPPCPCGLPCNAKDDVSVVV